MRSIERRPASGGGSCASCRGSLSLASVRADGRWYCSSACAAGRVRGAERHFEVAPARLEARPRRFFGARRPKELRTGAKPASDDEA